MKRKIALFIGLIMSATLLLNAGCTPSGSSSNSDSNVSSEKEAVETTDFDLVKNGATSYQIILPENATFAERLSATELNYFFAEATGLTFDVINETNDLTATAGKFISIGDTNLAKTNDVSIENENLGCSGYVVKTVEDDCYILGDDPGVIYGAYEFLEQQFDYHYFSDKVYTIDEDVTENKLVKYDVKEIPDIEFRQTQYGFEKSPQDSMYQYRMRLNDSSMNIKGVGDSLWHNFFRALPKSKYQATHPKWYSIDGTQLCLTRDFYGITAAMAEVVKEMLEEDPTIEYVHIGQEDTSTWCTCSVCSAIIENYGGYKVVTQILFINKVSDLLKPWLEEKNLDVKLTFFAYHTTDAAPVEFDEKLGEYKAISEDMVLRDNVCVLFAPIDADYYEPFDTEVNVTYEKNLKGWGVLAKRTLLWIYQENFRHYLVPFDNINSMKTNFQMARDYNVFWCYNQAQWNSNNSTGFSRLKAYVSAKLQWDADLDVRELIEEFFEGYFGPASDIMLNVFDSYRDWRTHCYYELGWDGGVYTASDARHWPYLLLNNWLTKIDEAYLAIAKYEETDYEQYRAYYDAINLESLAFRYQMINFNGSMFTANELQSMMRAFKKDAQMLRISRWSENTEITELWTSWGIS